MIQQHEVVKLVAKTGDKTVTLTISTSSVWHGEGQKETLRISLMSTLLDTSNVIFELCSQVHVDKEAGLVILSLLFW